MGCCTYVPKFPTWITPVCVLRWNFVLGRPVRQTPDITGQIQAQDQGSSEEVGCTAYFRYPKEHDRLRDLWDLGSEPDGPPYDVVSFALPGGRNVWYKVREVQAMNGGFANGHLVATLAKLTAAEGAAIGCQPDLPPDPPPPPPPPLDPGEWIITIVASPAAVEADGVEETTATLTLKWSDLSPVVGYTPTWGTTGDVVIADESGPTDGAGKATCTGTNATEETTHFTAAGVSSNDVEWTAGPPPGGGECGVPASIEVAGAANGDCDDCDIMNGTFALFAVDDHYESDPIGDLCGGPPYTDMYWYAICDDGIGDLRQWAVQLAITGQPGSPAQWNGPIGSGIGTGLMLTLSSGNTLCGFPATVELLP